jgi:hypothetical protein
MGVKRRVEALEQRGRSGRRVLWVRWPGDTDADVEAGLAESTGLSVEEYRRQVESGEIVPVVLVVEYGERAAGSVEHGEVGE